MTKTCSQCGETKPLEEFNKDKRISDGRRSDCKVCTKARNRRLYLRDRERRLKERKAYYLANRERCIAAMKEYDDAHLDAKRARHRAWREENRERAAEAAREWRRANPERSRALNGAKRARKKALPYEYIDRTEIYERDAGICGICGGATDPDNWHLDHIIPLARGGSHLHENVQVAHPTCNQRKWAYLPEELEGVLSA